MSEKEKGDEFNYDKFEVGFDAMPPRVMVVSIPIAKYADDMEDGAAMLHGKMREAEARAAKLLVDLRMSKKKNGIVTPAVATPPDLRMH